MDAGAILKQTEVDVAATDTFGSLSMTLADAGAAALLAVLRDYAAASGAAAMQAADDPLATAAPKIPKQFGRVDL
jgi:methionyl-tRNA formyltransferase